LMLMVGNERQFTRLCKRLELPALAEDPRFATNERRVAFKDLLMPKLREAVSQKPREHWRKLLLADGIPCGPINTISEVFDDPHVQAREAVVCATDPTFGEIRTVANPIRMSRTPAQARSAPTRLGADTEQVRQALKHQSEEKLYE